MENPSLAIVIPALDEERTIGAVVRSARVYGIPIVIDDGSLDGTAAIAVESGADLVVHSASLGYDSALNSGFQRAAQLGCGLVVTMDADGQHDPKLLCQFIAEFDRGVDVVIGVRDRRQRLAEHIFALVTKIFWQIQDPLCGMKGYRMTVYKQLGHFDAFGSIGTELALFAVRNDYRFSQISVSTGDRLGKPRFGTSVVANLRILRAMIIVLWKTRKGLLSY